VLFVEYRLGHEHGGERQAGRINHGLQRITQPRARDQNSGQNAGGARLVDGRNDRISCRAEHVGVAARRRNGPRIAEHRLASEIRRKSHVDRPAVIERFEDQTLGLNGDILWHHHDRGADHGVAHTPEQVVLAIAKRVMHEGGRGLRRNVRRAHQKENRKMFGVGAGYTVDRAQLADAVAVQSAATPLIRA
jgi:hypothetical protein